MSDVLNLDGDVPVIEVTFAGERYQIKPMEFEVALETALKADDSAANVVEQVRRISGIAALTPDQALAVLGRVKNYILESGQGKKKPLTSPASSGSTPASGKPRRRS